jgi:hypothetical protein
VIQTGFVAIKTAHARLQGCAPLRLLSIIADPRWTALLPILAWVIEHPARPQLRPSIRRAA